MAASENFPAIFDRLKQILKPYAAQLVVKTDEADNFTLDTLPSTKYPKGLFIASVQIKKNYVSFHLMPIYMFPDLVDSLSERLRKRKQGKSCFNFSKIDEPAFDELARLTQKGLERGKQWLSS